MAVPLVERCAAICGFTVASEGHRAGERVDVFEVWCVVAQQGETVKISAAPWMIEAILIGKSGNLISQEYVWKCMAVADHKIK